jgi:carboxymethylenebutenolidase
MIVQHKTVHTDPKNPDPQGYLVWPADDKTHPGIVLIQEWWGVEPHIRELAQRLALEGFAVIVPDIFHGQIACEPNDAMKLMMMVRENIERVLGEVELAAEYLRNDPGVRPKKLGVMGFCMGGFITYKFAERYPHLAAISPWYGGGYDPTPQDVAKINVPVLAMYGETDGSIPVAQVRKIEKMCKDVGRDIEVRIYPNAGHAFNNPDHGDYVEAAAKDAWARAVRFFKDKLR